MQKNKKKKIRLSKISAFHYSKLIFRLCLFLAAFVVYVVHRLDGSSSAFGGIERSPVILNLIWLVYVVEMVLRFFPSRLESMGCQKQFARNYHSTGKDVCAAKIQPAKATFTVAGIWILLNAGIGALYFARIIDDGILLLISLAYSVCDMICILFFCPFQTWFMKNKCCTSCRIYNWDYAMMFTPLILVKNIYTWSILAFAIALLIRWEITYYRNPERFSEATNESLCCSNCKEKLCHHKKQLRKFLARNKLHKREFLKGVYENTENLYPTLFRLRHKKPPQRNNTDC